MSLDQEVILDLKQELADTLANRERLASHLRVAQDQAEGLLTQVRATDERIAALNLLIAQDGPAANTDKFKTFGE